MLVVYEHNFRMLHWYTKGLTFDANHSIAEGYINKFSEFIDDIAEIILLSVETTEDRYTNEQILPNLKEIMEIVDQDQKFPYIVVERQAIMDDKGFNPQATYEITKKMFDTLIAAYDISCREDSGNSSDVISKLQEHQFYLRKESLYKSRSRLIDEE
jgi:DNA-binding ferritin-like protein